MWLSLEMAAGSVSHGHSDGKLEEEERKTRNDREANSQEHLTPMVLAGSRHLYGQKQSQTTREQRSLPDRTHAQSQALGNHPPPHRLCSFSRKRQGAEAKKSCSLPKIGQLCIPLKGKVWDENPIFWSV